MQSDYINDENTNSGHHNNWQRNGRNRGQDPYKIPKRRSATYFKCLNIEENKSDILMEKTGCAQVFDTINTANFACSLFEKCLLIGENNDGNFELFSESD